MKDFKERKVNLRSATVDNIDLNDYPDFVDAYINVMDWEDGSEMTMSEIEDWSDNNPDKVYDLVYDIVCC